MVGVHQNLNNSRHLTTLLSGMVCQEMALITIHGLALAIVNLPTKFEVFISTYYEDMKGDAKCRNGVVWGS